MLTPLELAIMKSIWRRRSAVVRDVQADLLPHRPLAYTTVMTVMDRLFKKGVVRRRKQAKAHVYEAACSESEARERAVEGLVGDFFGGSRVALRLYLQGMQGDGLLPSDPVRPEGPKPLIDDSLL